jgi:hypothetical protein
VPTALRHRLWPTAIVAATTLGLAACGSSSPAPPTHAAAAIPPAHATTTPRAGDGASVIRAWADTLRHGDIDGAAGYFAVPSTVSNGTGPITLRTRAAVRFFNDTLPCGAVLLRTEPAPHGLLIATFRLTERPGPGTCGAGVGDTAQTAFRIRDGQIVEWLRVADQAEPQGTPA